MIYTDEHGAYQGLLHHGSADHGAGECFLGTAHTQGKESFWPMLKRPHKGGYRELSHKHFDRYAREMDTLDQMGVVVAGLASKQLCNSDPIADNYIDSGARG